MKKKLKDVTIGEMIKYCETHFCEECPLSAEIGELPSCRRCRLNFVPSDVKTYSSHKLEEEIDL